MISKSPESTEELARLIADGSMSALLEWLHEGRNLLSYLVLHREFGLAGRLLDRGFPINENNYGFVTSALSEAAFWGVADAVTFLLERGANPDGHENEDAPPLHVALRRGHRDCVNLLLRGGARTDIVDLGGKTAHDRGL